MAKTTFAAGRPIHATVGPVTILWPHAFEPDNYADDEKYKVEILLDPKKDAKIIELIEDAVEEAISRGYDPNSPEKQRFKKGTKESTLLLPLHDGDEKSDTDSADIYEGKLFVRAKSSRRPTVLDANGQQIIDPEELYSGCICAVSLTVQSYNNKAQGVTCYLNHIMKLDDGERIGGGGVSAEEAFADYMGKGDGERRSSRSRSRDEDDAPRRGESRSRSRDVEDERPARGESRSRSRDEDDERRPSRDSGRSSRSRGRGSDDPMFD